MVIMVISWWHHDDMMLVQRWYHDLSKMGSELFPSTISQHFKQMQLSLFVLFALRCYWMWYLLKSGFPICHQDHCKNDANFEWPTFTKRNKQHCFFNDIKVFGNRSWEQTSSKNQKLNQKWSASCYRCFIYYTNNLDRIWKSKSMKKRYKNQQKHLCLQESSFDGFWQIFGRKMEASWHPNCIENWC